jgi:hypothetical protein
MNYHERLIELSAKNEWSDQDCFEIVKLIQKSGLPFGVMLIDAILLLQQKGKIANNENSKSPL